MAFKTFQNGYPLPASDLNLYLMNQAVIAFASASARDTAITSPIEGQVTWLDDTARHYYYDGSAWQQLGVPAVTEQTDTTYTIAASDNQTTIFVNNASGTLVTVADVLSPGERIDFVQKGAGAITFVADSGVTIYSKESALSTAGQYSAATLINETSGVYYLVGSLA